MLLEILCSITFNTTVSLTPLYLVKACRILAVAAQWISIRPRSAIERASNSCSLAFDFSVPVNSVAKHSVGIALVDLCKPLNQPDLQVDVPRASRECCGVGALEPLQRPC